MASITLDRLSKTYPGGSAAVRDVSLEIAQGELMVLLGPSGSGKSTLLRLVAGLESPTTGRILFDEADVTAMEPQARDLAMVFQSYALYPHKTVRDNLTFGLEVRGVARDEIARRVDRVAPALGIERLLDRRPAQLSGGERQRVALGRAVVREPRAFLLDEPLSNLDPRLRVSTRTELALLHRRLGATMIYVTHDQEEAMTLGTRIAVMRAGRVEQVGAPMEIFDRPANTFVAEFVGSPAINLLTCNIVGDAPSTLRCGGIALKGLRPPGNAGEGHVVAGIRPHDIALAPAEEADARGSVDVRQSLGSATVLHVRLEGLSDQLVRVLVSDESADVGDTVGLRLRKDRVHYFAADGTALRT